MMRAPKTVTPPSPDWNPAAMERTATSTSEFPPHSPAPCESEWQLVHAYAYTDEHGELIYENCKLERGLHDGKREKKFQQRRPNPAGDGYIYNLQGVRRLPYRLSELIEAGEQDRHCTEGEKDADTLAALGLCATSVATPSKVELEVFQGRNVVVHEDNDAEGRRKAKALATALVGIAASVRIVRYADLPEGSDVSDFIAQGHDLADVLDRCDAAAQFKPQPVAPPAGRPASRPRAINISDKRMKAWVLAWVPDQFAKVIQELRDTQDGQNRNAALNRATYQLYQLVARGWLDDHTVEAALHEACGSGGNKHWCERRVDAEATFRRARADGLANPYRGGPTNKPLAAKSNGHVGNGVNGAAYDDVDFVGEDMGEHPEDWAEAHLNGDDIRAAADRGWARANKLLPQPEWQTRIFTAAVLQHQRFPPIKHVVPGLITEGLNMKAGRPKIGKSWMALEIAIAVATGGTCLGGMQVEQGDVLYCACEDSERRLQSRMTKLLGVHSENWPKRLSLTTGWRRLDQGGVSDLAQWIKTAENPLLIILDTLASVKPIRATNGYQEDYAALESLHRLANDAGIAVLILHHQRKSEAEDPLDTISGTLGLAGCVDTPIILAGTSQGKTLYVRGRDVEETEHAVIFNKETCRWSIIGEAAEVHRSDTRKAILEVLKSATEAMGPQEIAVAADLGGDAVKKRLHDMLKDNEVIKIGRGLYRHPDNSK